MTIQKVPFDLTQRPGVPSLRGDMSQAHLRRSSYNNIQTRVHTRVQRSRSIDSFHVSPDFPWKKTFELLLFVHSYIFKLSYILILLYTTQVLLWLRATMSVDHKDTVPVIIHYSLPMPPRVIHVPAHFSLDEIRSAVHSTISQHVAGRTQSSSSITVGSSEFSSILFTSWS